MANSEQWTDVIANVLDNQSVQDILNAYLAHSTESPDLLGQVLGGPLSHSELSALGLGAPAHELPIAPLATQPPQVDTPQWHLYNPTGFDIHVAGAWADYTGAGVTVAVVDEGVQYTHPELAANYNANIDLDLVRNTSDGSMKYNDQGHGTCVAGVIAAANNDIGTTGVAYGASITSFRLLGKTGESIDGSNQDILQSIHAAATVDISNNSWGFTQSFGGNSLGASMDTELQYGESTGRGGLGTIYVFSAGNSGDQGNDTNYSELLNSRFTIDVGAINPNGTVTYWSSPGATVLVVAPGSNIYMTDALGSAGFSTGDYTTQSGTSFSAPIVSGIVALMLQANPGLGYRDVQQILAFSALNSDPSHSSWSTNGADTWNGGGLHVSNSYGFGLVDATAAVRLAETWEDQHTLANEASGVFQSALVNKSFNASSITTTINVNSDLSIEQLELRMNLTHARVGELVVTLISPDGTKSVLLNHPDLGNSRYAWNNSWSLSSTHHWGESAQGTWTMIIQDTVKGGFAGTLKDWNLTFYGSHASANDKYFYTNEFANLTDPSRHILVDHDGGVDSLNAAAVAGNTVIDLHSGAVSTIAGASLTMDPTTVIEKAYTGDGNDMLIGNGVDNYLAGGRGDDIYSGFSGDFGNDIIFDRSGAHDVLNLLAFNQLDVSFHGIDSDNNSHFDQLQIQFANLHTLTVLSYFDNLNDNLAGKGAIETLSFADGNMDFSAVHSHLV